MEAAYLGTFDDLRVVESRDVAQRPIKGNVEQESWMVGQLECLPATPRQMM